MRKLTAILLISVFAFSQYARQLSYLKCKFSNLFKATAVKCDCEKQAGYKNQNNIPSPAAQTHLHLHLDEYFFAPPFLLNKEAQYLTRSSFTGFTGSNTSSGHYAPPWQPPNSICSYHS